MALFSICRSLYSHKIFNRPLNIVYSEFHAFSKVENFSVPKKNFAPLVTPRRNFFWIFKKRTKREIRAKDQAPDFYQLIYRNGIDHYFLVGQHSAFFLSISVTLLVIYASDKLINGPPRRPNEDSKPESINNEMFGLVAAFIFTVSLFYFYMVKTPMRIYYYPQKQKYLLYFYGVVPNQIKKEVIHIGEIQSLPDKGILPWSHLRFQLNSGQKLLLFENYFRHPADLYVMLGWQKDPTVVEYQKVESKK